MPDDQKFMNSTAPIIVCGCAEGLPYTADTETVDDVPIQIPNRIRFCPLHAKAGELVEALKAMEEPIVIEFRLALCSGSPPSHHANSCIYCNQDDSHALDCPWRKAQALLEEIDNG